MTVQAKLQERGAVAVELAVLSSLQINTPSAANAQHYAELVREKAQQRRLIAVGRRDRRRGVRRDRRRRRV